MPEIDAKCSEALILEMDFSSCLHNVRLLAGRVRSRPGYRPYASMLIASLAGVVSCSARRHDTAKEGQDEHKQAEANKLGGCLVKSQLEESFQPWSR